MAHEIRTDYQPNETNVYACVFKNDAGTIKVNIAGGDTWEVFDDANIETYDIALTERGDESGKFTGTFPVIAAGRYDVVIYQGDKAEGTTQTVIGGEVMVWLGTAESFIARTGADSDTLETLSDEIAAIPTASGQPSLNE